MASEVCYDEITSMHWGNCRLVQHVVPEIFRWGLRHCLLFRVWVLPLEGVRVEDVWDIHYSDICKDFLYEQIRFFPSIQNDTRNIYHIF